MATASALISRFIEQHDQERSWALERLNERYSRMVVEAQWFQKEDEIATTVADQAVYAMPTDIEDLRAVYVGGTQHFPVSLEDIRLVSDDESGATSDYPLFAEDYNDSGTLYIQLWPVPSTSGDSIVGISSGAPVALTDTTDAAGTPSIPSDLHPFLYDGLNSDGYLFASERPDLAAVFEQRFQEGVTKLRQRRNSRFGSGATGPQIVVGGR